MSQASTYFSSGSYAGSLREMLDACEREKLCGFEFSSGLPYAPGLVDEARAARNRPFPTSVHNYFPPPEKPFVLNLAATDAETLEASLELCRTAIDLSADLGAPFYSVHSGFAMQLAPEQLGQPGAQAALSSDRIIRRADADRIFRDSVKTLADYAAERGLGLLLENNVIAARQVAAGRAGSLLMTTPSEIRECLAEIGKPNVGLLLDVGHAKVAAAAHGIAPERFFEELHAEIRALHLSDNDGQADSNGAFDERAWFAPFLPSFRHVPRVIEVYRLTPERRARQFDTMEALLK